MSRDIVVDTYDRTGVFVVVGEGRNQAPIVMETEGEDSSYDAAGARRDNSSWMHRACICRLVPVAGNELLLKDMERLQK